MPIPREIAELRENTPATDFSPPPQPRPAASPPPQQAASQTSAPPPAERQAEQAAAPQSVAGTQPSTTMIQRWQADVLRHLAQRRQYPPGAERRREQGIAVVRFSINGSGQVLSAALVQSSGFAELDQAAVQLVHRSSPIPPPPAGLPQALLTLTAPIEYSSRR
jgi:protein TonB